METLQKRFVIAMLFLGIFLGLAFTAGAEVKDLGEVCFDMFPNVQFEGTGGQLQVGVLSFGAGHFILEGKIVPNLIFEPSGRVHGNAFMDGNNITMSLTSSNVSSLVSPLSGRVFFFHIVLDATTLSGKWLLFDFLFSESTTRVLTPVIGNGTISIAQFGCF